MSDKPLLLVGGNAVADADLARFDAHFGSVSVDNAADIAALDEATRAGIQAVAFKGHDAFGKDQFAALKNLKLISNFGVGYDAIDVAVATPLGIKVTNTPDVLNDDVADLAVGMMLSFARELTLGEAWVRSGKWSNEGPMRLNRKLSGASVGIVGLGRIGQVIAKRLAGFDMDIHYTSRSEKSVDFTYHSDLTEMAKAVDWLVVAVVGGAETEGHVSRDVIQALGPEGVIVNISRGSTIDEAAMLDALEAGEIAGAALDVFLGEPHIDPRFLKLDNVHLQPHQGSATHATRGAMGQLQFDNVKAHFDGNALLTPVN